MQDNTFRIGVLKIRGGKLHIEGHHEFGFVDEKYEIGVVVNGETLPTEKYRIPRWDQTDDDGKLMKSFGFRVYIPLEDGMEISFVLLYEGKKVKNLRPSFGYFSKLSAQKGSYYRHGGFLLNYIDGDIICKYDSFGRALLAELKYLFATVLPKGRFKIACYRIYAFRKSFGNDKPIWIISDRDNVARDNGEALFKYISKLDVTDKDVYFALDENSEDFSRMEQYGQVIKLHSRDYRLKFLMADKIISAHASGWTINEFGDNRRFLRDVYDFDYVFLQHGITKDDISSWLNRFNRDISIFVTAANGEYRSILDGSYAYTEKEVKLTGFPRYDYLESDAQKKIVFLPTWRKGIGGEAIEGTQHRVYSETFKDTEYCKF